MTEFHERYTDSTAKQENLQKLTEDYNDAMQKGGSQEQPNNSYNPFDGGPGTNTALLITMMRLYDVGLALLSESNDELAEALEAAHARGEIVASLPQFTSE